MLLIVLISLWLICKLYSSYTAWKCVDLNVKEGYLSYPQPLLLLLLNIYIFMYEKGEYDGNKDNAKRTFEFDKYIFKSDKFKK